MGSRRDCVVLAALLAACGGGKRDTVSPDEAPAAERPPATAATPLLDVIPFGADAVLEIDLARLRANATVGPVLAAVPRRSAPWDTLGAGAELGFDPLADLDVLVAAAYRVGKPDAATLFFLRGERIAARQVAASIPGATVIDEHTVGVEPAEVRGWIVGRTTGLGTGLATDRSFLRLRDESMPAGATGAAIRLTARLSVDARISAAAQLGMDELPATLTVWVDVADDLALVALLDTDDSAAAERLAAGYPVWERQLGRLVRALGVPTPTAGAKVTRLETTRVKITWVVNPRMLTEWAAALARRLIAPEPR